MNRLIDADALEKDGWMMNRIVQVDKNTMSYQTKKPTDFPIIEPEPKWIPFKTRPLTEEEKEDHPEWDCILDCKLPDDGQRILVSINLRGHEEVQQDEFYSDDGSYLDSGYEIGTEAAAWMPLPEPYKEEQE